MADKIARIAQPANPTIEQVFEEFLAEQQKRLKPKAFSKYEDVIDLLEHHLNGIGHEYLSKDEIALFEKHYNTEGEEHHEFCQLFGPEKILGSLGSFLSDFMVRKVLAREDFKRSAGTVVKKLSKWLAQKGYVSAAMAKGGVEEGAEAARDLPKAERAAQFLREAVRQFVMDPNDFLNFRINADNFADEDYMDFDHYPIAKVESGKLWLEILESDDNSILGPITVPKKATELLKEGWEISCALGRIKGKWHLIEMANVYPL